MIKLTAFTIKNELLLLLVVDLLLTKIQDKTDIMTENSKHNKIRSLEICSGEFRHEFV